MDASADSDEGPLAFALGAKVVSHGDGDAVHKDATMAGRCDHLNGDWRVIPRNAFQIIHDRFQHGRKGEVVTGSVGLRGEESDNVLGDKFVKVLNTGRECADVVAESTNIVTATEKCIKDAVSGSEARMETWSEEIRKEFLLGRS